MSDVGRGPPTEEGEHASGRRTGSISRERDTEAGTGERAAPTRPLPALPSTGDVVAERYRIERSLGAGGMGHVFLAEHTSLRKQVALKILSPRMAASGDDQAARFLREARAGSRLSHPGIVDINDFGTTESGLPFFVMELLEGEDLGHRLDRDEQLPWPVARDLTLQILDALSAAHAKGVIHRDLKPENCFLTKEPSGAERIKLVDFGIAKLLSEPDAKTLTADGRILGTPHYMAPEQAIGKEIDGRADLYAATIMLFEMLTGRPPFNEGPAMAILSQHLTQPPPSLREVDSTLDVPRLLEAIIVKGLAKDPGERFASAEEFSAALRALDGSDAVLPMAGAAGQSTARRRPWGPAWGVLVLGGGLLLAAIAAREGDPPDPESPPSLDLAKQGVAPPASAGASVAAGAVAADAHDDTTGGDPQSTETDLDQPGDTTSTGSSESVSTATVPKTHHARRRRRPSPGDPASSSKPMVLEDGVVERHLQAALTKCRKWGGPGGATLDVRLSVADSGAVSGTTIAPPYTGDHPLGRCAAQNLNEAVLPAAEQGRGFAGSLRVSGISLGQ